MKEIYEVVVTGAINWESINGGPLELGGGALYAAAACARISNTKIISCVGNDVDFDIIKNLSAEFNLSTDGIEIIEGRTFKWFVEYSENQNEITKEVHNYGDYDNMLPSPKPVDTKVLLLSTGHPNLQIKVMDAMLSKYTPKYILLDSKKVHIKKRFAQIVKLLKKTNVFFATEEEINLLYEYKETNSLEMIFNFFKELKIIVIKKGSEGGHIIFRDGIIYDYKTTAPNKVIDTTNAGDIFAGTFAALLSKGSIESHEYIKKIALHAANIAALSVCFKGKQKIINSK
jgi:Sugar kinases, ribokinase family